MTPAPLPDRRAVVERRIAIGVLAAVLLLPMGLASSLAFPIEDDAWLTLSPVVATVAGWPDRPACGWLVEAFARVAGPPPLLYALTNLGLWALLALLIGRLWSRLFPEWRRSWPVASALSLAPIVVETQYTTATLFVTAVIPIAMGLGALLLILGPAGESSPGRAGIGAAFALSVGSTVLSEYGLVFAVCSVTLLICLGHWRRTPSILLGALAGYGVFRLLADMTVRDATDPSAQLTRVAGSPWSAPVRVATAGFYSLVGAYGRVADDVRPQLSSRSTLAAAFVGLVVAAVFVRICRATRTEERWPRRALGAVAIAIVVGLFAVSSQSTFAQLNGYESRLRMPVLPFAIALTLGAVHVASAPRWRGAVFALLGVLVGYAAVDGAFGAVRTHALLQAVGEPVRQAIGRCPTTTLAAVSGVPPGIDGEGLTAKATSAWSREDAARAWFLRPSDAAVLLGERTSCRPSGELAVRIGDVVQRSLSPCQVLWVSVRDGRPASVEPYCLADPEQAVR